MQDVSAKLRWDEVDEAKARIDEALALAGEIAGRAPLAVRLGEIPLLAPYARGIALTVVVVVDADDALLAGDAPDARFSLGLVPTARAIVGAPLTPMSVAGVARRTTARPGSIRRASCGPARPT